MGDATVAPVDDPHWTCSRCGGHPTWQWCVVTRADGGDRRLYCSYACQRDREPLFGGRYVANYADRIMGWTGYEIEPKESNDVERCYLPVASRQDCDDLIELLRVVRERLP
jgi:hypothetical protein